MIISLSGVVNPVLWGLRSPLATEWALLNGLQSGGTCGRQAASLGNTAQVADTAHLCFISTCFPKVTMMRLAVGSGTDATMGIWGVNKALEHCREAEFPSCSSHLCPHTVPESPSITRKVFGELGSHFLDPIHYSHCCTYYFGLLCFWKSRIPKSHW